MIETKNVVEVVSRVVNTIEEAEERIKFALDELKTLKIELRWAVRHKKDNQSTSVPFTHEDFKSALLAAGYTKAFRVENRTVFRKEGDKEMDEDKNVDAVYVSFFRGKEAVNISYNHNVTRLDVTTPIKSIEHFNLMLAMVGLDSYGLKNDTK